MKERIGPQGDDYTANVTPSSPSLSHTYIHTKIRICTESMCRGISVYGVALDAGYCRVWVSLTRYYCSDTTRYGVTHDLPWGSIDIIYNVGTNCHAIYIYTCITGTGNPWKTDYACFMVRQIKRFPPFAFPNCDLIPLESKSENLRERKREKCW